jgi:hypothetical protein
MNVKIVAVVTIGASLALLTISSGLGSRLSMAGPKPEPTPMPPARMQTRNVGDVRFDIEIQPNQAGQDALTILARPTQRTHPAPIYAVEVRFKYMGSDAAIEPRTVAATRLDPLQYRVDGEYLTTPGPWQIQVTARRMGLKDSVAQFAWTTTPPAAEAPAPTS